MRSWPVRPSPVMIVKTRASSGTARIVSSNGSTNRGATSLGFTITALPANSAGTGSRQDSISGPFHGLITPTSGYGTSWVRNEMDGMIELWPALAASARTRGASAAQARTLAATMRGDMSEIRQPPVSVKSAADSGPYAASSSSAHRESTSMRCSSGAFAQATWAARRSWQHRVSSSGVGGAIW